MSRNQKNNFVFSSLPAFSLCLMLDRKEKGRTMDGRKVFGILINFFSANEAKKSVEENSANFMNSGWQPMEVSALLIFYPLVSAIF